MTDTLSGPEVVRLENVRKTFEIRHDNTLKDRVIGLVRRRHARTTYTAADGLSLSIHAGTTVGLLGANGSGKSTLLKMIGGILAPDSGAVLVRGRIAALLELGAGFHPDLSGRENVYLNASLLGLSRSQTDERFDDIVEFSGIREFIDNEVKFYSSGMYMRLAFAVAVHTDPDILLVDEVLAVGDEAFQRKCMDKIREFQQEGRTIILVSHAASQIAELCDTTFVLDKGEIAFAGDTGVGISRLRDILEGRRSDGENADTDGEGALTIDSVEAIDEAGAVTTTFTAGRPLTLRVHLKTAAETINWAVGFGIDTPNGQMLIATSTDQYEGQSVRHDAGDSWHLDFSIDALHLVRGEYFVNVRAEELDAKTSSIRWQALMLHVLADERSNGLVAATIGVSQTER